jgi:hypothetical protein
MISWLLVGRFSRSILNLKEEVLSYAIQLYFNIESLIVIELSCLEVKAFLFNLQKTHFIKYLFLIPQDFPHFIFEANGGSLVSQGTYFIDVL